MEEEVTGQAEKALHVTAGAKNHLQLNIDRTKERVVDLMKRMISPSPIKIKGTEVDTCTATNTWVSTLRVNWTGLETQKLC